MNELVGLKEWDVQCGLLTRGETSLLIRKGGIHERHGEFEVEHRRFVLYPTYIHQNPEELRAEFAPLLRTDPAPGRVRPPALAEVVAVHRVTDLAAAQRLEPLQALTARAIARKFAYKNRPWVHALVLRIWPLREPPTLTETAQMLGCVSWVPLGAVPVETGAPAVSDADLAARAAEVRRLLGS